MGEREKHVNVRTHSNIDTNVSIWCAPNGGGIALLFLKDRGLCPLPA
jgi:hypothetical protein